MISAATEPGKTKSRYGHAQILISQRCQIKFPNIHVSLLEMFTKSSRMQFEDRKLSETVGIRRKLSVRKK